MTWSACSQPGRCGGNNPADVACAALFVGISTDTGWFRHSNTDARALQAAAALVGRGVHPHEVFQELYQTDTAARVRLLGV